MPSDRCQECGWLVWTLCPPGRLPTHNLRVCNISYTLHVPGTRPSTHDALPSDQSRATPPATQTITVNQATARQRAAGSQRVHFRVTDTSGRRSTDKHQSEENPTSIISFTVNAQAIADAKPANAKLPACSTLIRYFRNHTPRLSFKIQLSGRRGAA